MAVGIDEYRKLRTKNKDRLFTEIFELKAEKKILDDRLKELEAQYKSDVKDLKKDLFFELDNGIRFSLKVSKRKGSVNMKAMETDGIDVEKYRNPETDIVTLRIDK